jgi:hypothetical protein
MERQTETRRMSGLNRRIGRTPMQLLPPAVQNLRRRGIAGVQQLFPLDF